MIVLAGVVAVITIVRLIQGDVPRPAVMSVIGIAAIVSNLSVLGLLLSFRHGDANRRSVWICTRNDVIGNVAVLLAATGVFALGSMWPDSIVAAIMAYLGLRGGWQIVATARHELRDARFAHRT
jgi:Co/Zn/Cd efflux system component